MGLVARTEGIFFGTPMGRSSDRKTMAVVAEINTMTRAACRLCDAGSRKLWCHHASRWQHAVHGKASPVRRRCVWLVELSWVVGLLLLTDQADLSWVIELFF